MNCVLPQQEGGFLHGECCANCEMPDRTTDPNFSSFQNPVYDAFFNGSLRTQKVISVGLNLNFICGHACELAQELIDDLCNKAPI